MIAIKCQHFSLIPFTCYANIHECRDCAITGAASCNPWHVKKHWHNVHSSCPNSASMRWLCHSELCQLGINDQNRFIPQYFWQARNNNQILNYHKQNLVIHKPLIGQLLVLLDIISRQWLDVTTQTQIVFIRLTVNCLWEEQRDVLFLSQVMRVCSLLRFYLRVSHINARYYNTK